MIVQCKAFGSQVGPNVLRELEGVLHAEHVDVGLLVASNGFTHETISRAAASTCALVLVHLTPEGSSWMAATVSANRTCRELLGAEYCRITTFELMTNYNLNKREF